MRYPIAFLLVLAGPLSAQRAPIAPAPSVLFAHAPAPSETTPKYQGPSKLEGGILGGLGGMLAGLGLAKVVESQSPCGCEDPGLDRAVSYGLLGLVVGSVLGAALTGSGGGPP